MNDKLSNIQTRAQQAYDELDRSRRLVESYAADAQRERAFMTGDLGHTAAQCHRADEAIAAIEQMKRAVGGAVGVIDEP